MTIFICQNKSFWQAESPFAVKYLDLTLVACRLLFLSNISVVNNSDIYIIVFVNIVVVVGNFCSQFVFRLCETELRRLGKSPLLLLPETYRKN